MKLVTPASAMYSRELLRVSFQRLRVGARVLISAPYRRYRLNKVKNERSIATPNGIDSLESHILGHEKQWILVRGRDTNSPVMLFLQGG
ncbi:MAG TPA: hypothetical protein VJX67_15905, partial [Blastocatellia bacterium]|nr:hypothetical protein [Blastocatellia bacterium]